jgi:uncharacterized membrane protein YkvA (DUF1232 family)
VRWVVEKGLVLYYVGTDPKTPVWGKRALFASLLYIVSPLDLVPDFLVPFGEIDDFFAFLIGVAAVGFSIKKIHLHQARQTAARWFRRRGERPPPPPPAAPPAQLETTVPPFINHKP